MKTVSNRSRMLSIAVAMLCLFLGNAAFGTTKYWFPTAGGVWTTAANWSTTAAPTFTATTVPVAGDDIIINSNQSAAITAVPGLTLNSLTVSGNCTLQSASSVILTLGGGVSTNFSIANGATLTLGATVNITLAASATANISGNLTVGSGTRFYANGTSTVVTVATTGSITNNGAVTCYTAANMFFNGAASFTENNAASTDSIPTATWAITSTVYITAAFTSAATMDGFTRQTFGNVVYNCPSQTATVSLFPGVASSAYTTNIAGNFTITSTGSGTLYFRITGSSITGIIANIAGNFSMAAGTLDLNNSGLACPVVFNIGGDFTFSGGTIKCTSTTTGSTSTINYTKSGIQTITKAAGTGTFSGTTQNPLTFNVNNGSTLQMGTGASPSVIDGTNCSFTLSSGSSLGVTSAAGISAIGTNTGNIQVTTARSYANGNIIYNGTAAQAAGNGLTSAANVSITNTAGAITFSVAATVSGNISMATGATANLGTLLTHSANSLTLGGVVQATGFTYGGASSAATVKNATFFPNTATGVINILACSGFTWTGATSTDWNTTTNWCGGTVPISSSNVTIAAATNQPIIGNAAVCNNITINSGATVTISGSNSLTVSGTFTNSGSFVSNAGTLSVTGAFSNVGSFYGNTGTLNATANWTNSGTFIDGTGTVNFNGAAQTVTTTSTTTFYNVIISGTGQKTITTAGFIVDNIFSMEATGTVSAAPTYGLPATLQYNKPANYTAGVEWITNFITSGGVIVKNTGIITLNANKTLTACPLTVMEGATLNMSTFTIGSPNALNLVCGGLTAGATISGTGAITLGGDVFVTNAAHGTFGATVSCPVVLTASSTNTLNVGDDGTSATDLTISGIISSTTGALTKSGTGTLVLSGANTYTGLTTINAGTLKLGASSNVTSSGPLGTNAGGVIVNTGSVLDLNGFTIGSTNAEALTINGTGLAASPAGALTNTGTAASYLGTITLGSASNITATSSGTLTVAAVTNDIYALTIDGGGSGFVTGVIGASTGTLIKNGSGSWTISGTNTFTGGTTLNVGTLNINNASALGTVAGTFVINGGIIDATTSGITTVNYPLNLNADFSFTGTNNLNLGTGTITLGADRTITTTANTLTIGGTLSANTKSITKAGAGSLSFGGGAVTLKSLTISAGTLISTSGTLSLAGDFTNNNAFTHNSGTVTIAGSVAQAIGGSSTTSFNNLTISNNAAAVTVSINENISGTFNIGSGALVTPGAAIIFNSSAAAGTISGSGTIQVTRITATADYSNQYKFTTNTLGSMTVDYTGAGAQTVNTFTYGNLKLSTSGIKTFAASTTITGNVSVSGTASVFLQNANSSSATLTLGGIGQPSGSFGSTASAATYKNAQYFGSTGTGLLNVTSGSCSSVGTWIGATSTDWNTATNWCGNAVPTAATDVTIPSVPANQPIIGATASCNSLTINAGATLGFSGTYTLTVSGNWSNSGTFTAGTGTVDFNSSGTQLLTSNSNSFYKITHSGTGKLQILTNALTTTNAFNNSGGGIVDMYGLALTVGDLSGSGTITSGVAGPVILTAGSDNASSTFSGIIQDGTGTVSVIKNGNGALTLSGTNTYTGTTTISAGSIIQGNTAALGSTSGATTVSSGAVLDLSGYGTAEPLTINGSGTGNGVLINSTGSAAICSGAITLAGASGIGATSDITFSGIISGGYSLTKLGTGALTLSNNNTYTGGTTLSTGTLHINNVSALGTVAGTFSISGGTIDNTTGSSITTVNYPLHINGNFTFTGTRNLNLGTGNITLNADRTITTTANTLTIGGILNDNTKSLTKDGTGTLSFGSNAVTINALTINSGTLVSTSGTLSVAGNFSNSGTFTNNGGTVIFDGTVPQTISGSNTFNHLTIYKTVSAEGVSASANQSVNGILNLNSPNHSSTVGALDMGANTLFMGATATTTGTGDITGIVTRNTFSLNTPYSFGNQFTTLTLTTASTLPTSVSFKIVLSNSWKTSGIIDRSYDIIQSGGDIGTLAALSLHYLSGELNGANETDLDLFDHDVSPAKTEDQGSSNYSITDKWVSLSNLSITYIAESSLFDVKYWGIGTSIVGADCIWTGATNTDWNNAGNWTGGIPVDTSHVHIPNAATTPNDPTLPAATTIGQITIDAGGIVNGGTGTILTLKNGNGAWQNLAGETGFNAGTSTIKFINIAATMADPTNFYNVAVDNGAKLTLETDNVMRIAGALLLTGTGKLDAASHHNTVEYNGNSSQTILEANGTTEGYSDLIFSGTGDKTIAATINISGSLTNNCSGTVSTGDFVWVTEGFESDAESIDGAYPITFNNLTVNTNIGLVLSGGVDATVTGTLTFTKGTFTTNANHLILGSAGSCSSGTVSGANANNYVIGNLRRYIPNASTTVVYDIGDASNYTPVSITFTGTTSGCGYLEAKTTVSQPPVASGLSQSKYINRKWTLTNGGVGGFTAYSPTFTFVSGDEVGSPNTANLVVRKYNNPVWSTTTAGTRTTTTTQCTPATTTFGDFAIGEDNCTGTNGIWLGGTSTDWNTGSNWCSGSVPDATIDVTIPAGPSNQPIIGAAGGVCKSLTINSGASLVINSTYSLAVNGNFVNNGTFTANSSTVSMTGNTAQNIGGSGTNDFYNLTIANSTTDVTTTSDLSIASGGNLTINSGANFAPGASNIVSGAGTLTGSGEVDVTRITSTPDFASQYTISNKTLANLTVDYNGAGNQSVNVLNYGGLTFSNNGTRTVTLDNSGTIGIAKTFNPGNTNTYVVTGTTINMNGTLAQTISNSFSFNNLTISNNAGVTANADQTVSGVLNLSGSNASSTKGSLDMSTYTLEMGTTGTTTGTGDVTGIIKRTGTFVGSIAYSFGNPNTSIKFTDFPSTAKPLWVSCKIEIGNAPTWRSGALKRYYSFAQDGTGTDRTLVQLHYLSSELNSPETDESKLVFWDADYSGSAWVGVEPQGKTTNDATNKSVSLYGMSLLYLTPSSTLDTKQWGLSYTDANPIRWTGEGAFPGDWSLPGNWYGGVPTATDDVLIPAGLSFPYPYRNMNAINLPALAKTITIESGASVTVDSYPITISGSGNAWINNGIFTAGTGTVIMNGGSGVNQAITGTSTTSFNNLTVDAQAVSLNGANDAVVNGTLAFTAGIITTNANHLILGSAASVTGAGTGKYVNGTLRRIIPNATDQTVNYNIGDANNYTPVTIAFTGTTSSPSDAYIDASTVVAAPPLASGLSQTQYINRQWTLTNNGVTGFTSYSPSFTYIDPTDHVGSPTASALLIRKFNGSVWSATTLSGTPTNTSATATGLTSFSDFAIGMNGCSGATDIWFGSTSSDWNTAANWCSGTVPISTEDVVIPSGLTNYPQITANAACKNLTISSGASLSITGTNSLSVYGDWFNNGTFNAGTSTVIFPGTTSIIGFSENEFNNVEITGILTAPGTDMEVSGNWDNFGTFNHNNGTVTFSGTTLIGGSATSSFYNLTDSGSLTAPYTGNINVAGVWNNAGTFEANSGTVTFNGTSQAINGLPTTFYKLTSSGTDIKTLGANTTVNNTLTLTDPTVLAIAGNTLTLNGTITGTGTLSGSSAANLTIGGSGAFGTLYFDQTTDGTTNSINDIVVNRTATGTLSLGNTLVVLNSYTPTAGTLTTGGYLVIRSSATNTARVGIGSTSNYIDGDVTVERYIPANDYRAWRMLAVPTAGSQSINAAWQNGQAAGTEGPVNKGMWLTSNVSGATGLGYDAQTPGNSMNTYNVSLNKWDGLMTSTTATSIETDRGYYIYIRGDRTATNSNAVITATVLSTKGPLKQGTYPSSAIPVIADKYELVGNPYASAIDFASLTRTGGVDNTFYVWDPKLSGTYGLGAYQTMSYISNAWQITPGGGSYPSATSVIQSGLAFFVHATSSAGTVQFPETAKTTGSSIVFGPTGIPGRLSTSLFGTPGNAGSIADGNVVVFDDANSNSVNGNDALKIANSSENFGILRDGKLLAIEARQKIVSTDTIFFQMSGMKQRTYELKFVAENLDQPGLMGFLEDSYLSNSTVISLNDTTRVNITIDGNAGSYAANRFRIVFKPSAPLPVTFTSIRAWQQAADIAVEWKTDNELSIARYEVEHSTDGSSFSKAGTQLATGNTGAAVTYNWLDVNPADGDNFYRIRSIGIGGDIKYSTIVKVRIISGKPAISVYPNPVTDGNITVQFTDLPKGNYGLRLINTMGQVLVSRQLNHNGGSATQTVNIAGAVSKGRYSLQIIKPDGSQFTENVLVE